MRWGKTQLLGFAIGTVIGACIGGFLYFGSFDMSRGVDPGLVIFPAFAIAAGAFGGWLCAIGALLGVRVAGFHKQQVGAALGAGTVAVLGSVVFFAFFGAGDGTPKHLSGAGGVSLALAVIAAAIAAVTAHIAGSAPDLIAPESSSSSARERPSTHAAAGH
jgi:hypothetical protein